MNEIGYMAMPKDFPYREVFLTGKPQHDKYDRFRIQHPNMDAGKRAKIFAPFDALKGFNEWIGTKQKIYCFKKQLNEEEQQKLNRRLEILKNLTYNSRMARMNRVQIKVTYYIPCKDKNSEAYGIMGSYSELTGICKNVDEIGKILTVDNHKIAFADILQIEKSAAATG